MNVTPSKLLLGLSLAAYTYTSWDHIFLAKTDAAAPVKGAALSASVINRNIPLKLDRDPFNSVPLGQSLASALPAAVDPSKDLGELKLNGCMVTLTERAAVINGKTLHEGDLTETSTAVKVRVKKIGVGYCVIEGAGQIVMLRLDDKPGVGGAAPSPGGSGSSSGGGGGGAKVPYVAKDKQPQSKK